MKLNSMLYRLETWFHFPLDLTSKHIFSGFIQFISAIWRNIACKARRVGIISRFVELFVVVWSQHCFLPKTRRKSRICFLCSVVPLISSFLCYLTFSFFTHCLGLIKTNCILSLFQLLNLHLLRSLRYLFAYCFLIFHKWHHNTFQLFWHLKLWIP